MSRSLKGFFAAAGTGAVLAFASARARRHGEPLPCREEISRSPDLTGIDLTGMDLTRMEPLLDRLEIIEARLDVETEIHQRSQQIAAALPGLIEAAVRDRDVANGVELKVSERISLIERTLLEQAITMHAMQERAEITDARLQHLIAMIERLCERTAREKPGPVPNNNFEAQLNNAMEDPGIETDFPPRVLTAAEAEPKRARFGIARIFGAVVLTGIGRYFTR